MGHRSLVTTISGAITTILAAMVLSITTLFAQGDTSQKNTYSVQISPDGKNYAVLRQFQDQKAVAIYSVDNPDVQPVAVGLGGVDPGTFTWGGNDHVLVQGYGKTDLNLTAGRKEVDFARWLSIDKNTGKYKQLFGKGELGDDYFYYILDSGKLLSTLPDNNNMAIFARTYIERSGNNRSSRIRKTDDTQTLALFSANISTKRIKTLEGGNEKTEQWVVDANGEALARVDTQSSNTMFKIFIRQSGDKTLSLVNEINLDEQNLKNILLLGQTTPGGPLQALTIDKNENTTLVAMDLATGTLGAPLIDPNLGKIKSYEPDYREANASAIYFADGNIVHLDPDDQKTQAALSKALGGTRVAIKSTSDDGTRMIIKSIPGDGTPEYYLYDSAAKRLELVARE